MHSTGRSRPEGVAARLDSSCDDVSGSGRRGPRRDRGGEDGRRVRTHRRGLADCPGRRVPIEWAGDIYCLVLHHCNRVADLPRMRAWTQSMERWCENSADRGVRRGM